MRDIAILGAGPYGLSLAAHLADTSADVRIFGHAMRSWTAHMPRGMRLKSEGFASTLYDPQGAFRFSQHCRDLGLPYADVGEPVRLGDFAAYGQAFQQRFVPHLEPKLARGVRAEGPGFAITFADGETTTFRRVVVAVGIQPFATMPPMLQALPAHLSSHSAAHHDMVCFKGRTVVVVGGGSSATDCAAALAEAGAIVHIVARVPELKFHAPPQPRRWHDNIRWPLTTIGTGWRSAFCTWAPDLFHALPQDLRHDITRRHLGPVGCWFTRDIIAAKVEVHTATTVQDASAYQDKAVLTLMQNGRTKTLVADHVIAATGYKVDVDRLSFLDATVRRRIVQAEGTPVLSRRFESSVPGLFFIGVTAANAFGPLLRFACGAEFAATRLRRHLAKGSLRGARRDTTPAQAGSHATAGEAY